MSEVLRNHSDGARTARQEPLFVESLEEAIEATAMACGGKKRFACLIRPDLEDEPDKAHRWLLDALNHDRRTEFHAEHLRRACRIGREHGCHILKHWFDDATGYERGKIAAQKTERQLLAEEMSRLTQRFAELAEASARLDRGAVVREIAS